MCTMLLIVLFKKQKREREREMLTIHEMEEELTIWDSYFCTWITVPCISRITCRIPILVAVEVALDYYNYSQLRVIVSSEVTHHKWEEMISVNASIAFQGSLKVHGIMPTTIQLEPKERKKMFSTETTDLYRVWSNTLYIYQWMKIKADQDKESPLAMIVFIFVSLLPKGHTLLSDPSTSTV